MVADVDGDFVGGEREGVHGAGGAEADVDDVPLVGDGDDVDHVVPAGIGWGTSTPVPAILRSLAIEALEGRDGAVFPTSHRIVAPSSPWSLPLVGRLR